MRKLTTLLVCSTFTFSLNAMANETATTETVLPAVTAEVISPIQIKEQISSSIYQHWQQTKTDMTEHAKAQIKDSVLSAIHAAKTLL